MDLTTEPLGTLTTVDLREAWVHEAAHFTHWLARPAHLALLGNEIGIALRTVETEAAVGDFSVDILAVDEDTGRKVVIENQLETTDHDHLGKLITYASGHDASVVIWIAKTEREEHRQAIDWLNEHTDEDTEFYLVRIELWRIGASPPAPKFSLISKPNGWTKAMRGPSSEGQLTSTKARQVNFWNAFRRYAKDEGSETSFYVPNGQRSYCCAALGGRDAKLQLTFNLREGRIAAEAYIPDNKALFGHLLGLKAEIERDMGFALDWREVTGWGSPS